MKEFAIAMIGLPRIVPMPVAPTRAQCCGLELMLGTQGLLVITPNDEHFVTMPALVPHEVLCSPRSEMDLSRALRTLSPRSSGCGVTKALRAVLLTAHDRSIPARAKR